MNDITHLTNIWYLLKTPKLNLHQMAHHLLKDS